MSSRSMRTALLVCGLALTPLALWAQPTRAGAVPHQVAALVPSSSALDVPIEDIVASLGGSALLDKDFPGLRTHTMYRTFKSMSLNQIAKMSHGQITPAMLAQADADLVALPITVVARRTHQAGDLDFASPDDPVPQSEPK